MEVGHRGEAPCWTPIRVLLTRYPPPAWTPAEINTACLLGDGNDKALNLCSWNQLQNGDKNVADLLIPKVVRILLSIVFF
jgi:hypothetical protein